MNDAKRKDNNRKLPYIGRLIKEARESKYIRQEVLCKGLCNRAMLVRIEQGKCIPEKVLMDAMLQRLGLSVNKFGTVYTKRGYQCYELRREILGEIMNGEIETARQRLSVYEEYGTNSSAKALHKQFIGLSEILIGKMRNGKHEERMEDRIRKTLCLTCPDFREKEILNYLLHDKEITLLLLLAEDLYHQRKKEEALNICFSLTRCIDKNVSDEEELTRLYPKIALLLSKILLKEGRYEELYVCERGIQILRENHKITFLGELLSVRLAGWEGKGIVNDLEDRTYFQMAVKGLRELTEEVLGRKRDIQLFGEPVAQGNLIGNQIASLRGILGLTQGDFGDICDPASLSRIENGREPSDRHYRNIMERMGREGMRYYPFILSEKYALHVARDDFSRYIVRRDYNKAENALRLLETGLDVSESINRQYVLRSRALLDNMRGLLSREELLEILMEAIQITTPVRGEQQADAKMSEEVLVAQLKDWPLTQMETVIWNNIANAKADLGKVEEKIKILSLIKENYERNPVDLHHNAAGYLITIDNLVNELEAVDADREALRYCEEGIRICLLSGEGYTLVRLLVTKASCLRKVGKDEKACRELLQQAFSIAYVLGYKAGCNYIEKYCEEHFVNE